ncbi:hypothetical protein ZWY2020_030648 [Hordeum vulgare]|nr:hypothetical protein ZWY2020_030648 [Hordeum vulgare]
MRSSPRALSTCLYQPAPTRKAQISLDELSGSSFFFYDDEVRLLVEYQVHNFMLDRRPGRGGDSGEFDSTSVMDDISEEDFQAMNARLRSRIHEIDETEDRLDGEELDMLTHKYAQYRLKACMDSTRLALTLDNYLLYRGDEALGWCFDLDLCLPAYASLTDYQRLVSCNEGGDEYRSWSEYREFYNTPETDRDYLLYWETIVKDLKWVEEHVRKGRLEWHGLHDKAWRQAMMIATRFENIHMRLAYYGFLEYTMSNYLEFAKDLDSVFFEIWKLVNVTAQMFLRDAMKHVYEENQFPLRKGDLQFELRRPGSWRLVEQYRRCTEGISKEVPEWIARKLISQEVSFKCDRPKRYVHYARKKLKIAEIIGLIPKSEKPA